MAKLSSVSLAKLKTCDERLQKIVLTAVEEFDLTVLEGHRTAERQKELFASGNSRTMNSKHLAVPSQAVDLAPYPIDWEDTARFAELAAVIKRVAKRQGVEIVWGGDWKTLVDMPHYEIS